MAENTLLLKDQKQAITGALNGEDVLILLPTALRKPCIYIKYKVLPFIVSLDTSPFKNKAPGWEFTGLPIMNFIQDWEPEIVDQFGLQTNS